MIDAMLIGHVQIEDDQVEVVFAGQRKRLVAIVGRHSRQKQKAAKKTAATLLYSPIDRA